MALEGGTEPEPTSVPPPTPELPLPMQDSLRGFLGRTSPRGQAEGPQKESIYYYMGAFMSVPTPGMRRPGLKLSKPLLSKRWRKRSPL